MAAREEPNDRPQTGPEPADGGPEEAARFISETVTELAQLSRRHRLDMLGHLLEMAQLEAVDIAQRDLKPKF